MPIETALLRPPLVTDAPAVIALIDAVYREYGDQVCLNDADSDLPVIDTYYAALGGEFVVLVENGRLIGTHAVVPLPEQPGVCTFRRLYLEPAARGTGAGNRLMRWAIDRARSLGFHRVEFWSDTRFARAHCFFERFGFQRDGREREMHDSWRPYSEYFFYRDL